MKYLWACTYEYGWGVDYGSCGARCKKYFKSKEQARKNANAHADRKGHTASVWEVKPKKKKKLKII